jgi:cytochrome P450
MTLQQCERLTEWLQTPVSISTYLTRMDPEIFPEPYNFRPERWIEARQAGFPLQKYLVAFSRGNRQCLGMRYVNSRATTVN